MYFKCCICQTSSVDRSFSRDDFFLLVSAPQFHMRSFSTYLTFSQMAKSYNCLRNELFFQMQAKFQRKPRATVLEEHKVSYSKHDSTRDQKNSYFVFKFQ